VDVRNTAAADAMLSIDQLLISYRHSFEIIYLCHVLEHFHMHSITSTLSSFRDLLIPGSGKLYVSVPDFQILSAIYLAGIVPFESIVRAIHGGQEYIENIHYISFDFHFLARHLLSAGFKNVRKYSPEDFLPFGTEDTSTYRIGGKAISLNLTADF